MFRSPGARLRPRRSERRRSSPNIEEIRHDARSRAPNEVVAESVGGKDVELPVEFAAILDEVALVEQVGNRNLEQVGNFNRRVSELVAWGVQPSYEWTDAKVADPRDKLVEAAEDFHIGGLNAELFVRFAECSKGEVGVGVVNGAARKADLTLVVQYQLRPLLKHGVRLAVPFVEKHKYGRARTFDFDEVGSVLVEDVANLLFH